MVGLSGNRFSGVVCSKHRYTVLRELADALGVRTRADNQHVSNDISTPSQEEHADALGVSRTTIDTPSSNLL